MFDRLTRAATEWTGSPPAVVGAALIVLGWALTGPIFGFSDTWQLVINTGTTIVTFNMVFVIQAAQNRDGQALQAKLDELVRALDAADNRLIGLEEEDRAKIIKAKKQVEAKKNG